VRDGLAAWADCWPACTCSPRTWAGRNDFITCSGWPSRARR
jgi:hypothetical protein